MNHDTAKLLIIRGPDEGKVFLLEEELVQIGCSAESHITLADDQLAEHQASILRRNGRFAIYTPVEGGVEVEGNPIPVDQWVWLPASARLSFGSSTLLQFRCREIPPDEAAAHDSLPPDVPARRKKTPPEPRVRKAKSPKKQPPDRKRRKVARFITDRTGDTLVKLGEDGKLPELALADSRRAAKADRKKGEKGSPLLYIAVGGSLLMSVLMLLLDTSPGTTTAQQRARARREITRFYGTAGNLQPYQRYLREARQAHQAGDRLAEQRAYRKVLDLLNSEDVVQSLSGLTGDKRDDAELRRLIGILMDRGR